MSNDLSHDPDHNPPLSQALVNGPDHLVKPTKATTEDEKPLHGVKPKQSIEPRPKVKDIAQDREGYLNRHPFDSGRW